MATLTDMLLARVRAALLAVSVVMAAAPVHAQDVPASPPAAALDEVFLHNGGLVRGRIVELLPEVSVTIRAAADGRTVTFPWNEVASTSLAPPCPTTAPEGELDRPRLWVTLERPASVQLRELLDHDVIRDRPALGLSLDIETTRYRVLCTAPCDLSVEAGAGQHFFFAGDRVPRSRVFSLADTGPWVHASVRPGRPYHLAGGLAATPLGFVGVVVGTTLLGARGESEQLITPGALLVGIGSAVLATGIALLLTARTRVRLTRLRGYPRAG